MVDRNIQQYLYKTIKMLRRARQYSDYYEFCYRNMMEMTCEKLSRAEKKEVMKSINKVREGGYPEFPAVKDCFFNSILISLFSKGKIKYVEGWYWDIVPLEHGWCKIGSKCFDPTTLFNEEKFSPNIKYFGMVIRFEEIATYGVSDLDGHNPEVHSVIPHIVRDETKRKEFN